MEIERKWLLSGMPLNLDKAYEHSGVYQLYPSIDPLFRVMRKIYYSPKMEKECRLTVKSKGTLSREEYEINIANELFDAFARMFKKDDPSITPVFKDYYIFDFDGYKLEVSNVEQEFAYCEIEFESEEEAKAFDENRIAEFLKVMVVDVTDDPYYKMVNYWKETRLLKHKFTPKK